jgi:hypothetical protein
MRAQHNNELKNINGGGVGLFDVFLYLQVYSPHYGSGVDSASNKNEYQEYFLRCKDSR